MQVKARIQAVRLAQVVGWTVAAAVALPGVAQARVVTFTAHFDDPGTKATGFVSCPAGTCFKLEGAARFTGALTSSDTYYGYGWFDPVARQFRAKTRDTLTGSLAGCGRGSLVVQPDVNVDLLDPTTYDMTARTFRMNFTWSIAPGSGKGDFAGATGSGTGTGQGSAPGPSIPVAIPNRGTFSGTINCPERPPAHAQARSPHSTARRAPRRRRHRHR